MPAIGAVAPGLGLVEQAYLWLALEVASEGVDVDAAEAPRQCDEVVGAALLRGKEERVMLDQQRTQLRELLERDRLAGPEREHARDRCLHRDLFSGPR